MPDPALAPVAPTTPRPSRRFVRWAAIIAAYMAVGTVITVGVAWGFAVRWQTPGVSDDTVFDHGAYRHDLGYLRLSRERGFGFETIELQLHTWDFEGDAPTDPADLKAEKDRQWAVWHDFLDAPGKSEGPAPAIPVLVALESLPPNPYGVSVRSLSTGWPIPALTLNSAITPSEPDKLVRFSRIPITRARPGQQGMYMPVELRRGFAADVAFWSFLAFALVHGPKRVRSFIRNRRGRCIRCGYSVAGLTGTTCPECGSPTRHSLPTHSTPS